MTAKKGYSQESEVPSFFARIIFFSIWFVTLSAFGCLAFLVYRAYQVEVRARTNNQQVHMASFLQGEMGKKTTEEMKAAIIIDDLGRDIEIVKKILKLNIPVTLSVLPYRRYSGEISRMASQRGYDVLLHLPMQPRKYPEVNPGPGCLLLSMDQEEIQAELMAQIKLFPYCVGVNNHMGSIFIEKKDPMRWILSVLRGQGLFFVDSLTTPDTVAPQLARELGVLFTKRTHFLDDKRDEDYIIRQLCDLIDYTVQHGTAVGIGHPFEETLAALPKVMAAFKQKGIRLVPVSELVMH